MNRREMLKATVAAIGGIPCLQAAGLSSPVVYSSGADVGLALSAESVFKGCAIVFNPSFGLEYWFVDYSKLKEQSDDAEILDV